MLRSEHSKREGDQIIANGGRQDELDELTEASHKASHKGSLRQQVKEKKTMVGDENDQLTRLIERYIVQSKSDSDDQCVKPYIF